MSIGVRAQGLVFDHLDVANGLSQRSVLAIAQDGQGFIWLATRNGLNRYDGHAFRIYKNSPGQSGSLANNYVNTLLCDSRHILWIGTNGGLDRYDPVNDSFQHVTPDLLPSRTVNAITRDRAGNLWIGTPAGLGWIGAPKSIPPPPLSGVDVKVIYEDRKGTIWIGTSEGAIRLTRQQGKWESRVYKHTNQPGSLSNDYASSFLEDGQGRLWVGTHSGMDLYHPETGTFSAIIPGLSIRKIILDRKGRIWVGALEGLTIYDPVTTTAANYRENPENSKGLSHNSIYSLFQDAGASVWIGTYFGGANIVNGYATPFTVYKNSTFRSSISNNVVSGLTEGANGLLYIGTEGGGMNVLNRKTGLFTIYRNQAGNPASLGSNLVKIIYGDKAGRLWVGTHDGGLQRFDADRRQFIRYPARQNGVDLPESEVDAIVEDRNGRLWVGSQSGLRVLEGAEVHEVTGDIAAVLKKRAIHTLTEDDQGNLWVGTTSGLYVFSSEGKSLSLLQPSGGLSSSYINCVQQDSHHRMWIGKYYGGLAMYDPQTKQVTTYTEKDGLANSNVLGVLEDGKGYIWISTDNGLCRLDIGLRQFLTYTASDGLAENGFNYNSYYKDREGKMWFGGYSGLTSFFPDSIETNNYIAPVVFTGLKLFNNPAPLHGDRIIFHHDENVFTLEFALLNYTKSDKNRYVYRLIGFDKQWNEVSASSATYTNLPAGDYTFEVKGANNDGVWSAPAAMQIRILPPWWATWWAYILYVLLLGGVVFFISRFFFLRALLRRDYELHQIKLNFFTNVSHEIRTHLTLISGPVEKMLGMKTEEHLFHQQLQYIRTSADRLLRLVEELMDFRKAETNHLQLNRIRQDMVGFVRTIAASFEEQARSRGIHLSFSANSEMTALSFDNEQMEKVFFNLLTNAFKFTPDGGTIRVELEEKNTELEVRIIDNGKGIAPEYVKKLFQNFFQINDHNAQNTGYGIGLALSRSIVRLHKGELVVESSTGVSGAENRTCFAVRVPLDQKSPALRTPAADNSYTLLVAEDNEELRSFIVDSLAGSYLLIACADGQSAWEAATEQIPDLVISDVMMPGLDGLELCGRLKSDPRTNHIPVILLTAKAAQEHQVSGLEVGADVYLVKPFSQQVLELHIHNLLSTREAMRQKFTPRVILQPYETPELPEDPFLEKLTKYIETHMGDPEFSIPWLSAKMEVSQPVLYKKVKAVTNLSVNDFIKFIRMQKAAQLLLTGKSVQETASAIGFTDTKYFSREFKKQFGRSPSEHAKGG